VPLNDAGRAQARRAARVLAGRRFAAVFTSPMKRATETGRIAGYGHDARSLDDLREWNYGDYEGRRTVDIRETRPGWLLWRDGAPGGERAGDVGARADRVIHVLRGVDGDALVFGHGHMLRVLGARWVDLRPEEGGRLALSPGSVSVLGWEREVAVLQQWNHQP
jgi:probable phosphoglycerate mutase